MSSVDRGGAGIGRTARVVLGLCSLLLPLVAAAQGDGRVARLLDAEVARAEAHLRSLESRREQLDERRTAAAAELESARGELAELVADRQVAAAGSDDMTRVYRRAVGAWNAARAELERHLEALVAGPHVEAWSPGLDLDALGVGGGEARIERIQDLARRSDALRRELIRDERALSSTLFEDWAGLVSRLNRLRVASLHDLPRSVRARELGWTREGIEQLRTEIDQARLSARVYAKRVRNWLVELPSTFTDIFTVGAVSWLAIKVLVAIAVFVFLRRRGERILKGVHNFVRQAANTSTGRRRGEALVRFVAVLAPWGSFLLLVWAVRALLGKAAEPPEIDLPLRLATLYGAYRMTVDALFGLSVWFARRYRLTLDAGRTQQMFRTIRALIRVVVFVLIATTVAEQLLGRGHLYRVVLQLSVVVIVVTALVLVQRWRPVIAEAYLARQPKGRFARWVDRTRDRGYGLGVSVAAFLLLAGGALYNVARDTVMGFDQTRRALAFLFRRRMEKQAERSGYADYDLTQLPDDVRAAFAEDALDPGSDALDLFPGLEDLNARIRAWQESDSGDSFLLSGEKGMGKTSWLRRIDPAGMPIDHVEPPGRVLSASKLAKFLAGALGIELPDEEPSSPLLPVREFLKDGQRRIVVVDLAQNFFLTTVGEYRTFEDFVELVDATCDNVFWVFGMSRFACDHLSAVRPDLMVFRGHQRLSPWSEEQIAELIRKRTRAVGIVPIFDDLMVERTYDAAGRERRLETEAGYMRLLWDYSDGNPRAALHFWLRSLVPDGERRYRVRLFRAPSQEELAELGSRARFLLKAIVVHENLSLREVATVTRYPVPVCRIQLNRMEDLGILRRTAGRYRLDAHWHRAVVRFLRRGNLLSG